MGEQICRTCGKAKSRESFYRIVDGRRLPTAVCAECLARESREFHRKRKERERAPHRGGGRPRDVGEDTFPGRGPR